jgi:hypothetical protein
VSDRGDLDNSAEQARLWRNTRDRYSPEQRAKEEQLAEEYAKDIEYYEEAKYVATKVTITVESSLNGVPSTKTHVLEGPLVFTTHVYSVPFANLDGLMISALAKRKP